MLSEREHVGKVDQIAHDERSTAIDHFLTRRIEKPHSNDSLRLYNLLLPDCTYEIHRVSSFSIGHPRRVVFTRAYRIDFSS